MGVSSSSNIQQGNIADIGPGGEKKEITELNNLHKLRLCGGEKITNCKIVFSYSGWDRVLSKKTEFLFFNSGKDGELERVLVCQHLNPYKSFGNKVCQKTNAKILSPQIGMPINKFI